MRTLHTAHPLVDLRLLRRRNFAVGTAMAAVTMVLLSGSMFGLTQLFAVSFGSDALSTGLRLLPLVGGLILGTRLGGRVIAAVGQRNAVILFSLLVLAASLAQVFSVGAAYWVFAVLMAVLGAGIGGIIPVSMFLAMGELSNADAGSGSALIQAIRQICSALGVAVLGSVTASTYTGRLGDSTCRPTCASRSRTASPRACTCSPPPGTGTWSPRWSTPTATAWPSPAGSRPSSPWSPWPWPGSCRSRRGCTLRRGAEELVDGSHLPGERVEQH